MDICILYYIRWQVKNRNNFKDESRLLKSNLIDILYYQKVYILFYQYSSLLKFKFTFLSLYSSWGEDFKLLKQDLSVDGETFF